MKKIISKLVKSASTILNKKVGTVKMLLTQKDMIGNGAFILKRGLIKAFDNNFDKLSNTLEIRELTHNVFKGLDTEDMEIVESVEIKEKSTKLISKQGSTFIDTDYYMYLINNLEDIKMYINWFRPLNGIRLDLDNNVVGLVCAMRTLNFDEQKTLEELKKEIELKELSKKKNDEYIENLANEYIEYHNKSLINEKDTFLNIVKYEIEKINKSVYQVVGIDNEDQKHYYFKLNMLNCDVKLLEQKQIFKLIKDHLLNSTLELQNKEDNKINDLTVNNEVPEVAADPEQRENNKNMEVENMSKNKLIGIDNIITLDIFKTMLDARIDYSIEPVEYILNNINFVARVTTIQGRYALIIRNKKEYASNFTIDITEVNENSYIEAVQQTNRDIILSQIIEGEYINYNLNIHNSMIKKLIVDNDITIYNIKNLTLKYLKGDKGEYQIINVLFKNGYSTAIRIYKDDYMSFIEDLKEEIQVPEIAATQDPKVNSLENYININLTENKNDYNYNESICNLITDYISSYELTIQDVYYLESNNYSIYDFLDDDESDEKEIIQRLECELNNSLSAD